MGLGYIDYGGILTDLPFDQFLDHLREVKGARVYDIDEDARTCKVGLALPDGETELTAIINVLEESYLDTPDIPEVTPPCYLQFKDVIEAYQLAFEVTRLD